MVSSSVQDEVDREINDWAASMKAAPAKLVKPKKRAQHPKISETEDSVKNAMADQKSTITEIPSSKPTAKPSKTRKSYQEWDKFDVEAEVDKVEADESINTTEKFATNPIDDRIRYSKTL